MSDATTWIEIDGYRVGFSRQDEKPMPVWICRRIAEAAVRVQESLIVGVELFPSQPNSPVAFSLRVEGEPCRRGLCTCHAYSGRYWLGEEDGETYETFPYVLVVKVKPRPPAGVKLPEQLRGRFCPGAN
jgi:hypothetical protein